MARLLVDHDHTAEHVADIGLGNASDSDIWDYAQNNEAVIVTKDEDFPRRPGQIMLRSSIITHAVAANTSSLMLCLKQMV